MPVASTRRSLSKRKQASFRCAKDSYPDYRDFGLATFDKVNEFYKRDSEDTPVPEDTSGRSRGGKKSTFPKALYQMVDDAEDQNYEDVIAWMPHGRSFTIKDKERFTSQILPRYFGSQNSFASFQRQLNVYGFLRMTKNGPDRKSYYHELFLRGREDLISLIPRRRNTTAKVRRSLDPETEPNLYSLPPCIRGQTRNESIPEATTSSLPMSVASHSLIDPEETLSTVDSSSTQESPSYNPRPDVAVSFQQQVPELALSGEESSNASSTEESPDHCYEKLSTEESPWQFPSLTKICTDPRSFCDEEYHILAHPEDAGYMASFHVEDLDVDRF